MVFRHQSQKFMHIFRYLLNTIIKNLEDQSVLKLVWYRIARFEKILSLIASDASQNEQ